MTLQQALALMYENEVTSIGLRDRDIGPAGARDIAKALENNQSLTSIDLGRNIIGPEGTSAIAKALENNQSLTSIDLGRNDIGNEGARVIAKALEINQSLTSIKLGLNHIGPEGARDIAKALEVNQSLTSISLWDNDIGPEGARDIAQALENNQSLTSIDLGYNNIGPEGATAIAKALETNQTLASIGLSWNNIGNEGARAIAKALENNQFLTSIDLYASGIGDEGRNAIDNRLACNKALNAIDLLEHLLMRGKLEDYRHNREDEKLLVVLNRYTSSSSMPQEPEPEPIGIFETIYSMAKHLLSATQPFHRRKNTSSSSTPQKHENTTPNIKAPESYFPALEQECQRLSTLPGCGQKTALLTNKLAYLKTFSHLKKGDFDKALEACESIDKNSVFAAKALNELAEYCKYQWTIYPKDTSKLASVGYVLCTYLLDNQGAFNQIKKQIYIDELKMTQQAFYRLLTNSTEASIEITTEPGKHEAIQSLEQNFKTALTNTNSIKQALDLMLLKPTKESQTPLAQPSQHRSVP